jgi:ankyrin repeat protein
MEPIPEFLIEHQQTCQKDPVREISFFELTEYITGACNPNITDHLGMTPLHYLAMYDTCGFAITKICEIPGINLNAQNKLGCTPLHKAAAHGNIAAAQVLLKHNVHMNTRNYAGQTPLHWALYGNDDTKIYDMVFLLLEHHARPDVPDRYGWSAYHRACWKQKKEIAKLLLKAGALKSRRTPDGKTGKTLGQEGYLLQRFPKLYRNYALNSLAPKRPEIK